MSRRTQASVLLLLCALLTAHSAAFRFTVDDAYISFRYADNWADGNGIEYNVGERVEGYSNFGWVALLAGLHWLGADTEFAAKALGLASALALLVCLYHFARRRWPAGPACVAVGILALSGPLAAWAQAGLETSLFALLVFASAASFAKGMQAGKLGFTTGVLLGLAALIRVDGVLVFACLFLALAIVRPRSVPGVWRPVVSFAAIYVPYFAWRWAYYGQFVPNVYYVKVTAVTSVAVGRAYLVYFLREYPFMVLALVPVLVTGWRLLRRGSCDDDRDTLACFGLVSLLYMGYVVGTDGDWMALYRRFVPVLALLSYLVCACLVAANAWVARAGSEALRKLWPAVRLSLLALAAMDLAIPSVEEATAHAREMYPSHGVVTMRELTDDARRVGLWLKANASPGDSLATHGAGALAYYSELRVIGYHGLTDAYLARHGDVSPGGWPGHKITASDAYILSKEPTFIIGHPHLSEAALDGPMPSTQYPGYVRATFTGPELGGYFTCDMRRSDFDRRARPGPSVGFVLTRGNAALTR